MNCKQVLHILPELASGEVDDRTHGAAMDHISECEECRAEMLEYEDAFAALRSGWAMIQASPGLDSFTVPAASRTGFPALRLGLVTACVAMLVAAAVLVPTYMHRPSGPVTPIRQALTPHEPQKSVEPQLPRFRPEKQPQTEDAAQKQPETRKIEKQEPTLDQRRLRPLKPWDHCASAKPKPKLHAPRVAEPVRQAAVPPEQVSSNVTCPDEPPVTEHSGEMNAKPTTHKVTREIITYDRYGNKQITLQEVEEPEQPCKMALY